MAILHLHASRGTDTRRIVHRDVQLILPLRKSAGGTAGGHRLSGRCLWPEMPVHPDCFEDSDAEVPESPYIEWYVFSRKRQEMREERRLLQRDSEERSQ